MSNNRQQETEKAKGSARRPEPGYKRGKYKKDPNKPKSRPVSTSALPEDLAVIQAKYGSVAAMIKLVAMQIRKDAQLPPL